jgi:hypothetical protein
MKIQLLEMLKSSFSILLFPLVLVIDILYSLLFITFSLYIGNRIYFYNETFSNIEEFINKNSGNLKEIGNSLYILLYNVFKYSIRLFNEGILIYIIIIFILTYIINKIFEYDNKKFVRKYLYVKYMYKEPRQETEYSREIDMLESVTENISNNRLTITNIFIFCIVTLYYIFQKENVINNIFIPYILIILIFLSVIIFFKNINYKLKEIVKIKSSESIENFVNILRIKYRSTNIELIETFSSININITNATNNAEMNKIYKEFKIFKYKIKLKNHIKPLLLSIYGILFLILFLLFSYVIFKNSLYINQINELLKIIYLILIFNILIRDLIIKKLYKILYFIDEIFISSIKDLKNNNTDNKVILVIFLISIGYILEILNK